MVYEVSYFLESSFWGLGYINCREILDEVIIVNRSGARKGV
jgi:hypothetical protein